MICLATDSENYLHPFLVIGDFLVIQSGALDATDKLCHDIALFKKYRYTLGIGLGLAA